MKGLYVVGTPIGNLQDMSYRAIETLKQVDFIAAEDTRVTLKLLNHFEIKKPMISYYEHTIKERGEYIISRIIRGESCAIVSDAGMPCISDPGEDLVRLCIENGIEIKIIPGPSAVISGLCLSGFSTSRFTFEGFLSTNKSSRIDHLKSLEKEMRTMIFYEAPHKLVSTLTDMKKYFGNRNIALARELTKIYEQVLHFTIDDAIKYYEQTKPKGEFVLIVEGAAVPKEEEISIDEAVSMAIKLIKDGEKATQAAKIIAKQSGHKKSDIYSGVCSEEETL
ncbi:MAG: 16S rRNA (cytidine(1402)-2'-O)-methyltransferase [Oscillospiraceae bacterium]